MSLGLNLFELDESLCEKWPELKYRDYSCGQWDAKHHTLDFQHTFMFEFWAYTAYPNSWLAEYRISKDTNT